MLLKKALKVFFHPRTLDLKEISCKSTNKKILVLGACAIAGSPKF